MKIEGSLREILDFIEKENPEFSAKLREKMSGAMLSLVSSDEMKQGVETMIMNVVETRIHDVLDRALKLDKVIGGYGQPNTYRISGFMAETVEGRFRDIIMGDKEYLVRTAVRKDVQQIADEVLGSYKNTADNIVESLVRQIVPGVVSETYSERVADRFDRLGVSPMIDERIQSSIGRMVASGVIKFNVDVSGGKE
ncbi:hypothetical protein ACK8P5_26480 (plasmid) [Paenibacillus sp. EC2-1]|uniref:hypothetical protein n=1 Tax=Paenibacillus sp. EC2-1 TaxID=3388665 RepID=UPI003BEEBECC